MKIYQLPDGARFLYQGEEYVKTGPMFGTGKDGQRLIPRYAFLQPLDPAPASVPKKAETLSRAVVVAAFERFYGECRALVGDEREALLERARAEFLKSVD